MISVVIPNYNGEMIIKPCLDSLQNLELPIEVIVIDNASVDKSPELIQTYPVKYIQNSTNVGFAKAVNQGIKAARYPFVFLMNSDVVIEKGTLGILLQEIEKDLSVFSVQPKMMQFHHPDLIDDAGDIYTPFGWAFQLGHGLPDKYYNKRRRTFSCCAGAALYRKSIFEEIGYFDESFFAYMEDVDIGFRARRFGYENIYTPKTKVFHIGSASFGKQMTDFRAELSGRNNMKVVLNNMSNWGLFINFPMIVIGFLIKSIKYYKDGYLNSFLKGAAEAFKNGIFNRENEAKAHQVLYIQTQMYINVFRAFIWKIRLTKTHIEDSIRRKLYVR